MLSSQPQKPLALHLPHLNHRPLPLYKKYNYPGFYSKHKVYMQKYTICLVFF